MMKKLVGILVSATLAFGLLTGCGAKDEGASAPATEEGGSEDVATGDKIDLKFAWSVDNVDLSQQAYIDSAQEYVEWLNESRDDISVELVIMDGQSSVDKEISDIETAIAMNVDGIIITCADPVGLLPICKEAMAAGIPVLDWRDMGRECTVTIDVGNENSRGEAMKDWFKQYLETNPDENLKVGLQWGAAAQTQQYPRFEKLHELAEEMPERFEIVVENYGDWGTDTSMKMMEDWLQAYDLNCVVTANEEMMIGVSEVLKAAGVLNDYILTCYNGEKAGLDMLEEGTIAMDVGIVISIGSPLLVEYAIKMALEGFSGYVDLGDDVIVPVTQENLEEFRATTEPDYSKEWFKTTLKESYK